MNPTQEEEPWYLMDLLEAIWTVLMCAAVLVLLAAIATFAAVAAYDFGSTVWCEHHPSVDADGYPVKCGGDGY